MESQPQNPEFRNNLENFHPCKWRIFHDNSCFIKFIKQVEEKRKNTRLAEHFITFSQQV